MLFSRLREDVETVFRKDPAARTAFEVLTCYPGLHALWLYRLSHWLWRHRRYWFARFISHLARFLTGIEIHPGAMIGRRVFIDHGMGIVIGETAVIGDDVLIYKGAVLGGVSLTKGKRHPTIGDRVVIGSNATILGPVEIGHDARIGSGAVVVKSVPEDSTAVGVPARIVRGPHLERGPAASLSHAELPDPFAEQYRRLTEEVQSLEKSLEAVRTSMGQLARESLVASQNGSDPRDEDRPKNVAMVHNGQER
ncbi:MAG: serine O-acetyltransferase [Chloroflexi bacterium]|nr:serine O-acetyltransferase [Chloroflexota bacterium]